MPADSSSELFLFLKMKDIRGNFNAKYIEIFCRFLLIAVLGIVAQKYYQQGEV
jgi:hypothetical protein